MEHRSKNKVFWRFSHIYWGNTYWKTSFFMCSGACLDEISKLFRVVFAKNTLSSSTFPLKFSKIFRKATFNYICSLFIPSSFCFSRSRKKNVKPVKSGRKWSSWYFSKLALFRDRPPNFASNNARMKFYSLWNH